MSILQNRTAVQEVHTNNVQPYANKDSYKFSVFPRSVVDWNHLPASIRGKSLARTLSLSKSTRPTRSNQTNNFIPISTRTSYHKASFFPSTIPMWNSLAESVKTSTSVAQFRTGLYNSYQLNQSAI